MPVRKNAWTSWNYLAKTEGAENSRTQLCLTYWMNRLQNIDPDVPLFVTLNAIDKPNSDLVLAEFDYDHPIYTRNSVRAQKSLSHIQGKRGLWFTGAWLVHLGGDIF